MYIKYDDKAYQDNINLRELINISGEVLGTFETKTDKKGAKTKINIVLENNCIKVTEDMITESFDQKKLMLFNISTNKIITKTNNQLKLEKLTKIQSKVLDKLKDVRGAISSQETTNKYLNEDPEEAEVFAISKDDIKKIGKYQYKVATFDKTWNPDDFKLEDINELMFNGDLILPEIVTRLL